MTQTLGSPTLGGANRGPRFAGAWASVGSLFIALAAYVRWREGPDGPWIIALPFAVASLFGVAQGLARRPRRYVEWGAGALIAVAGALLGWFTAQIPLGYLAEYTGAAAWLLSMLLAVIGGLLCILRSTRRVGVLFCVAGLAGLAAFYAVIGVAHVTGHIRWNEWKHAERIPPTSR